MIKILSVTQIRELDQYTIAHEPIGSIELMERACQAFTDWFFGHVTHYSTVLIMCGPGNNGGDGLAIARLLAYLKYDVSVCLVTGEVKLSPDCQTNWQRLPPTVKKITFNKDQSLPQTDVIIDALFGSGLSRPLQAVWAHAVEQINGITAKKISVDIPSGLLADKPSEGAIVMADQTVTFQLPKLSFFFPQYRKFVGDWHVLDIGANATYIKQAKTPYALLDVHTIQELIKPRDKFSHKGTFGHALVVAGSIGKMGANVLATRAALRAGSGLVTSLVPKCGNLVLQTGVPEAMVLIDDHENCLTSLPDLSPFTAIGIGPGLGRDARTVLFLDSLLRQTKSPCILDADALNILADNLGIQKHVPENSLLTPHPGEFKRLVGEWKNDFERLQLQQALSQQLNSIVILKGAHTSIAIPDGSIFFNATGNPAMATGGSGDVLTGILTGLLAQGYEPKQAALIGVFVHGLAGDLAAKNRHFIIASDIIEQIPSAFSMILASDQH